MQEAAARPVGPVLITGGAGFIGRHLAQAMLRMGLETRILDDLSAGSPMAVPSEAVFFHGSVCDEGLVAEAIAGVQTVYHLAAIAGTPPSWTSTVRTQAVNLGGSVVVGVAAAKAGIARLVLASSAAVYGTRNEACREDDPLRPESPYALDKATAESYLRMLAQHHGFEAVVARFFNVYGPEQNPAYAPVVPLFAARAKAGQPARIEGDGLQTRDFIHVLDVVRALCLLGEAPQAAGEIFNLAGGRDVTILEVWHKIAAFYGCAPHVEWAAARAGDVRFSRADVGKIAERLGFHASIGLQEGIELTLGGSPSA